MSSSSAPISAGAIATPRTSPVDAGPDVVPDVVTTRTASGSLGAAHSLGVDPERLLLDAAALRRRQLCAAFLHGSARSWRIRRRIWPAAVAGLLIVAITIAALAVAAAFTAQQQLDRERQSRSIGWALTGASAERHESQRPITENLYPFESREERGVHSGSVAQAHWRDHLVRRRPGGCKAVLP